MAYKWGRSMTSCNIKELPLLPPTANTNTNTNINDWQDTSSNISLSEYRERLLRRNMIDDPNADYSTDVMPLPPMLQTTTYSLLSEDLTTLTTLRPPEIDNENDHLKAPFCEPLHSTNMSIQSPIPSIHSNEAEDFLPDPDLDDAISMSSYTKAQKRKSRYRPMQGSVNVANAPEKNNKTNYRHFNLSESNDKVVPTTHDTATQFDNPFKDPIITKKPKEGLLKKFSLTNLNIHFEMFKKSNNTTAQPSLLKSPPQDILPRVPPKEDYHSPYQYRTEDQRSLTSTSKTYTTAETIETRASPLFSASPLLPPLPPKSPVYDFSTQYSINSSIMSSPDAPFWKYHILKFGKDLYLTTNPGMKHVYCRNAPGYFIEVVSSDPTTIKPTPTSGYSLIFRDSTDLTENSRVPFMVVTKRPASEGGEFTFSIPKDKFLNQGTVVKYEDLTTYNGVSFAKRIDEAFFPYTGLRTKYPQYFQNHEIRDLNNVPWNIGSIPRVRSSKMTKIKETFKSTSPSKSKTHPTATHDEEFKFIGKRNIYFHQNYVSTAHHGLKYREFEPRFIYGHDYGQSFPPVLAMFRPFETRTKKKIIRTVKNNKHYLNGSLNENPFLENVDDQYGTETKKFYQGSDGLYYLNNTSDDLPDENKLGWITIYEDLEIFGGIRNRGMFDIVVGMTLAVGYDSCLSNE